MADFAILFATIRSSATLAAGGSAFGAMVFEFFSPGLPQLCKNAGAEFVLFDMEHTGLGFETLKNQFALCRGLGIVPMVRVPRGEYHFIARALDVGALGVMVPMVGTADEARAHRRLHALSAARTARRGVRLRARRLRGRRRRRENRRAARADDGDPADRDRRGLANVEAIAAVPGVDALWLGHFDLTNFLGIPGAVHSIPTFWRRSIGSSPPATRHGKTPAFLATDDEWARDYRARKGFRLLAYGIDSLMLQRRAARTGLARAARARQPKD